MNNQPMVMVVLAVLALIGVVAAITSGRRATKRAAKGVREVSRLTAMVVRVLVSGLVITAIQWAIVTNATDVRVVVGALLVPALFAGGSIARMLAVREVVYSSRRGGGH